jgi:hypothetical protein
MSKIIIAGGPRTSKTTYANKLSKELNIPVVSTDNFIACGWSEAPHEIIKAIENMPSYILEGVNAGRTIRKMVEKNIKLDFDKVYYLEEPVVEYDKKGQAALAKGCSTVWMDVIPSLDDAGIEVIYGLPKE